MNLVVLIGHLGNDPEVKYTQDGKCVASFSLATTKGKDKPPDWHRVVTFGDTAGLVGGHLHKGDKVAVNGTLTYNQWTDREGNKKTQAQVIGNRIEFMSKKNQEERQPTASEPDEDIPF